MGNFQTQVKDRPAMAVEGDFASHNPRKVVLAGPGGLVTGDDGVTVGRFAWLTYPQDADGAPAIVNNYGFGPVAGFVHREQQGLITEFLGASSLVVPKGFPITLHADGDFWVKNAGAAMAVPGMKAFADMTDGSVSFAAAGSVPGGASGASASIANTTLTVTGSVADDILTITAISAGLPYNGAFFDSGCVGTIVEQLTGAAHGAGTYRLSVGGQTVASTTLGGHYGLLTNGTVTGTFEVGMVLSGTGVDPNTTITELASGDGGTGGTSVVSSNTVVSSTTITGSTGIETKWIAMSQGSQNELVKISSQPLG